MPRHVVFRQSGGNVVLPEVDLLSWVRPSHPIIEDKNIYDLADMEGLVAALPRPSFEADIGLVRCRTANPLDRCDANF